MGKYKSYFVLFCGSCLTLISPRLNNMIGFYLRFGRFPNLKDPTQFNEKLLKIKLENYDKNNLVKLYADKFAVREYVASMGFSHMLNDLIAVYDSVDEINWDALPEKFALKWNFGCGFNVICEDKAQCDAKSTLALMKKWGKKKVYLWFGEMHYRGVAKKVLIEKYLGSPDGVLPSDYKVYCFNGQAKAILMIKDRETGTRRGGFFTRDWRHMGMPPDSYTPFDTPPGPPASLDMMLEAAEKLSKGFPFVRVDFYECGGKAIFGEMTFTPSACQKVRHMPIDGVPMADMLP